MFVEEQNVRSVASPGSNIAQSGANTTLTITGLDDITPNQNLTVVVDAQKSSAASQNVTFSTDGDIDGAEDLTVTSTDIDLTDTSGEPDTSVFQGEVLAIDNQTAAGSDAVLETDGPEGLELRGSTIDASSSVQTFDTADANTGDSFTVNITTNNSAVLNSGL